MKLVLSVVSTSTGCIAYEPSSSGTPVTFALLRSLGRAILLSFTYAEIAVGLNTGNRIAGFFLTAAAALAATVSMQLRGVTTASSDVGTLIAISALRSSTR